MIIIDRIEGAFAVCETDTGIRHIPAASLPEDVREGDVLTETAQGYCKDSEATQKRRLAAAEKLRRILKNG